VALDIRGILDRGRRPEGRAGGRGAREVPDPRGDDPPRPARQARRRHRGPAREGSRSAGGAVYVNRRARRAAAGRQLHPGDSVRVGVRRPARWSAGG
jgi:hypothetical protein